MKRFNNNMDGEATSRKRPRQDPVSCLSCRKRKLKCDRKVPCSGCTTRRIECIYYNSSNPDVTGVSPSPSLVWPNVERIHQDELQRPQSLDETRQDDPATHDQPKDESLKTMDWLETIVMGHWTPSAVPMPLRADLDPVQHSGHVPDLEPKIHSPYNSMIARNQSTHRQSPSDVDLKSYLPPRTEALHLFRYYCDNLDFHFRAIMPQEVERQINIIYDKVSLQQPIDLNNTALLFSIIAAALHFKLQPDPSIPASAYSQAAVFLCGAALIQSNYAAYPTIEGLQATMIVGQNLSSTGMPPAVSSLFVPRFAINQAICMNLHLVDSPRFSGTSEASLELKRRIWWSLVSNDW